MEQALFSDLDGVHLDGLIFCSKAYALFEVIRSQPDGPSRLRMRPTDLEKKLVEEILPVSRYVQESYRPGRYMAIRWLSGDQAFDAELSQRGAHVGQFGYPATAHIEVTGAMHAKDYLMREALEINGGAFGYDGLTRVVKGGVKGVDSQPVGFMGESHIVAFSRVILESIEKKRAKTYPADTVLIVYCALNTVYPRDEWERLMELVRPELQVAPFSEIFLYDTTMYWSHHFWPARH